MCVSLVSDFSIFPPNFTLSLYLELMYHRQYQPEISTDAPISNLGECDPLDLLVTGNHIVAKY